MSSNTSPRNMINDEENTYVITRTGRKKLLDTNLITKRIQSLINRKPKIRHVNPFELMLVVCQSLKSNISTYEIDEYAANSAASLSLTNPYYMQLAGRIAIDNHQKNTKRSFIDKMKMAYLRTDNKGKIVPLLSKEFITYVEENQDDLEKMIDWNRDFLFDFFGFRTFQSIYAIKINDNIIERPQDMYMRTAIAIHMNTSLLPDRKQAIQQELNSIKNTYDLLSKKYYTQASTAYFNGGSNNTQYASCFLLGTHDSLEGIMGTVNDAAVISKWGGGVGIHCNEWRGSGSLIRGTNGNSSGIVPFLKIYNSVMCAFNQGGKRKGRAAIYLMPHHPDIMKFLSLNLPAGQEEERARDLFYALWIPDIFMERVKTGQMWSLFDPDHSENLANYYGDEYTKKYLELEEAKLYSEQIPARDIWDAVYTANEQKGHPYILFSDNVNRQNNQSNLGTIKSSNLCVSEDTMILTENGYENIKYLTETNNGQHKIWNGFEYSKSQFMKTGTDKELLLITFSDGTKLKCTKEHRFIIKSDIDDDDDDLMIEVSADSLKVNDTIIDYKFPVIDSLLSDRLKWLSKIIESSGRVFMYEKYYTISFIEQDEEILKQIKLNLNTMGVNPMLYTVKDQEENLLYYYLNISESDTKKLYDLGLEFDLPKNNLEQININQLEHTPSIQVQSIELLDGKYDTYCFNEPKRHMGIFNGVLAGNCSEIVEYSNEHETAVCNLSSISLSNCVFDQYTKEDLLLDESKRRVLNHEFPLNPVFDFKHLLNMAKTAATNLDILIDKNFYPTEKTRRSNMRHRPIGIGIQGLADAFIKMRYPFESDEASDLNKKIMETIYFGALTQSTKVCKEKYQEFRKQESVTMTVYEPNSYEEKQVTYTKKTLPKTVWAYPSMMWNGGSPIWNGKFHWELAGLDKSQLSGMWDWDTLREHIQTYGIRNSLVCALMPTATTSQLLGNNECFEPYTSNIYKRKTLAGEHIVINKYLIHDLYRLKLWTPQFKEYLLSLEGSIQAIEGIPDEIKKLYKTAWEIPQQVLIDRAIERQPFVDQSQSLNLYIENLTKKEFTSLMFRGWRAGLKTGKYYVHTRPAVMPQKFTIDPELQKEMEELLAKEKNNRTEFLEPLHEECDLCSA